MKKWALVTGATAGIGESFTRLLAAQGFNLVLVARDETRLHERAQGLKDKFGAESVVIVADLATESGCAQVEEFIKMALEWGEPDGLVVNEQKCLVCKKN